ALARMLAGLLIGVQTFQPTHPIVVGVTDVDGVDAGARRDFQMALKQRKVTAFIIEVRIAKGDDAIWQRLVHLDLEPLPVSMGLQLALEVAFSARKDFLNRLLIVA